MEGIELVCFKMISALGGSKIQFYGGGARSAARSFLKKRVDALKKGINIMQKGMKHTSGYCNKKHPVSQCNYRSYSCMRKTN